MKTFRRVARCIVAIVAIAGAPAFRVASANHYILPCTPQCAEAPSIPIGPGMTGTWVDAAQSSHGLMIEVLPGQPLQMSVRWFTFGPGGGQAWIGAEGPVNGNEALFTAYRVTGSGARFPPNFHPANVREEPWGTLYLTFRDCNHGYVQWIATAPGYGSGAINIVRLTSAAGLGCSSDGSTGGTAKGAGGNAP